MDLPAGVGLGLAALGRPGYLNLGHGEDLGAAKSVDALRARTVDVLDTAWENGVRYVDVARSYGRAEEFLAGWLEDRELGREDIVVGSKWGYEYTAGWQVDVAVHEEKDHSVAHLRHQWPETQRLLGDRLSLYQIHSATPDSGVLGDRAVLDELAALREGGLTIGITTSGPAQRDTIRRALEVDYDGRFLFEIVQATWNLLEHSAEAALEEAAHEGIGVIGKEALANGRLTERNRDEPELVEMLGDAADALGVPLDAAAIAGVLARPWCDTVLSGAVTADQLQSNLLARTVTWTEAMDKPFENVLEEPEDYWRTRSHQPWT
jgi:aryl-alcohol dehydrogenase-like predicted oxidoreductase